MKNIEKLLLIVYFSICLFTSLKILQNSDYSIYLSLALILACLLIIYGWIQMEPKERMKWLRFIARASCIIAMFMYWASATTLEEYLFGALLTILAMILCGEWKT